MQFKTSLVILVIIFLASCAPAATIEPTSTVALIPTATKTLLTTETFTPEPHTGWPMYSLATELPDSPAQLHMYSQAFPARLPEGERLTTLQSQLQITGTVSTYTGEGGDQTTLVEGESGSFWVWSDDPLSLSLQNGSIMLETATAQGVLPPEVRAQKAEAFLNARDLLDFEYRMEPPHLSRVRDYAIRVVPLIEGYPLHDYDALNGRLLAFFDSSGEVAAVYWRPLKLVAGELVDIVPASVAWEQLVKGNTPKSEATGYCWQASVFNPDETNGAASPINDRPCVSYSSGPTDPYEEATINKVDLVYFANDLSLGMSPFTFPADSPARLVYPMWQFSGTTDDGRELEVLWPALPEP